MRLEWSTLLEHANGNFIVLRVLKIIDPIKPVDPLDDMRHPVPYVGCLLLRANKLNRIRSFNLGIKNSQLCVLKDLLSFPDIEPDL